MKLVIFGATGGTGTRVVQQACAAGHDVTAVVRNPAALEARPNLTVLRADLMDAAAIGPAVAGRDAVISAVGSREGRTPTTVCADSASAIIAAMREHGTRRLVVVSNSGMHVDEADGPVTRLVVKPILGRMLRHSFADMRRMEDLVRDSGLDWTILRPPMLTDGPRTDRYRTATNRNVRGGNRVSRADLADLMLRCLADELAVRASIAIAN
ncbi:NAD(P)-dependent oxidoreductase [Amycolatopsis sp. NPDC003676]